MWRQVKQPLLAVMAAVDAWLRLPPASTACRRFLNLILNLNI
jgi:hypothetical protein